MGACCDAAEVECRAGKGSFGLVKKLFVTRPRSSGEHENYSQNRHFPEPMPVFCALLANRRNTICGGMEAPL
jgi:hypothetical protein